MEKTRLEELRRLAGITEKTEEPEDVNYEQAAHDADTLIWHATELKKYIDEREVWKGPVGGKVIRCLTQLMGITQEFGDPTWRKIQAALKSIDLLGRD